MSKIFISYSWDNDEHKKWVKKLATDLRKNGVDVILDQWDLRAGEESTHFMEDSVTNSERVLIILTNNYRDRCNNRIKGVGYETSIITAEIYQNVPTRKFIPVLREGEWASTPPVYLRGRVGLDMTDNEQYDEKLAELLEELYQVNQKPVLGKKPVF